MRLWLWLWLLALCRKDEVKANFESLAGLSAGDLRSLSLGGLEGSRGLQSGAIGLVAFVSFFLGSVDGDVAG